MPTASVNPVLAERPIRPSRAEKLRRLARLRVLELAMHRGHMHLDACVEVWVITLRDGNETWERRHMAAEALTKRFGLPPATTSLNVNASMATPKTVVHVTRSAEAGDAKFEPPPSYSEVPPPEVLEAMRKFSEDAEAREAAARGATNGTEPGGNGAGDPVV